MKLILSLILVAHLGACVLVPAGRHGGPAPAKDVVVCHKGKKTMTLPGEAARAHIDHGDRYGACR